MAAFSGLARWGRREPRQRRNKGAELVAEPELCSTVKHWFKNQHKKGDRGVLKKRKRSDTTILIFLFVSVCV